MPAPHRKTGLGLGEIAGFAGRAVVLGWLRRLSQDTAVLLCIGRTMYEAETMKPWSDLPDDQKRIWTGRASDALLGLREHLEGPKEPPK